MFCLDFKTSSAGSWGDRGDQLEVLQQGDDGRALWYERLLPAAPEPLRRIKQGVFGCHPAARHVLHGLGMVGRISGGSVYPREVSGLHLVQPYIKQICHRSWIITFASILLETWIMVRVLLSATFIRVDQPLKATPGSIWLKLFGCLPTMTRTWALPRPLTSTIWAFKPSTGCLGKFRTYLHVLLPPHFKF